MLIQGCWSPEGPSIDFSGGVPLIHTSWGMGGGLRGGAMDLMPKAFLEND